MTESQTSRCGVPEACHWYGIPPEGGGARFGHAGLLFVALEAA
jgi:hypothetical protein